LSGAPANAGRGAGGGASLTLRGVGKRYGDAVAVHEVDLDVAAGEFVTLLGASGSGKTTTLMMIAGFTEPSRGEILVDRADVTRVPPSRRNLGVVFQNYSLFPHLTVSRNIAFPLEMRGIARTQRNRMVADILDLVRLADKAGSYPRELSGGQQQRIALARALVFGPPVLLMDEPLGALDKKLREHMQLEIKRIHAELGTTVVYVTHDQEEALTMSDRVAVMQGGRIAQIGRPADLYDRPASRWVADFVGQSNFIAGTVLGYENGVAALALASGATVWTAGSHAVTRGQDAMLVVRPEKLRLVPAGEPVHGPANGSAAHAGSVCRLEGVLIESVYLGHATRSTVRLQDGATLQVQEANRSGAGRFETGTPVAVTWVAQDGWLLPSEETAAVRATPVAGAEVSR
jgi:spermidine/putrescine ABC transporter ATP-binding subunit